MLPSNLLLTWNRKGTIQPRFAQLSPENLKVANQLIIEYNSHVGAKKETLRAIVTKLENQGYEYRFVRALALLLERKSIFICDSKINPPELRKKIFEATEKVGAATTEAKRRQILQGIALETGFTVEQIEEQLYADLDAELILEKFEAPTAEMLLKQYNLSLAQTLLFDCTELSFKTSSNWQQLFHIIKKLGLIYEVSRDHNSELWVKIDGPASLFKLTKHYGVNIAKCLPVIVASDDWTINAKIFWRYKNQICDFKLEAIKHKALLPEPRNSEATYDSAAEESFASMFQAAKPDWTLKREPEPLPAGTQVIIPDFSLEKAGFKVYLEIVGFWTKEYLLRKTEKLKHVEAKMILLVNEALACDKLSALEQRPQLQLIYYRNKISLSPVLGYLQAAFEEVKAKETALLKTLPVKFTEPTVSYTEFAQRIGVSHEAVEAVFSANPPEGYVPMHNGLVSKEKLDQISSILDAALKQSGKLTLPQATKLIESENVNDVSQVLSYFGFKIIWRGINSEQADVVPQKSR